MTKKLTIKKRGIESDVSSSDSSSGVDSKLARSKIENASSVATTNKHSRSVSTVESRHVWFSPSTKNSATDVELVQRWGKHGWFVDYMYDDYSMDVDGRRGSYRLSGRVDPLPSSHPLRRTSLSHLDNAWTIEPAGPEEEGQAVLCQENDPVEILNETRYNFSCHGVSLAFSLHRSMLLRILWGLLMCVSTFLLGLSLWSFWNHYSTYPILRQTENVLEQTLPFPAVTICSNTEIDMRNLHTISTPDTAVASEAAFRKIFASQRLASLTPQLVPTYDQLKKDEKLKNILNMKRKYIYTRLAPQMDKLFVVCGFNGVKLKCKDMFKPSNDFSHCFDFNNDLKKRAMWSSAVGPESGLYVLYNSSNVMYSFQQHMGAGINVILHNYNTFADNLKKGTFVSAGASTFMKTKHHQNVQLGKPYKSFGDSYCDDAIKRNFDRDGCLYRCVHDIVQHFCNCSDSVDTLRHFTECTFDNYLTCYRPRLISEWSRVHLKAEDHRCMRRCPRPCSTSWFTSEQSHATFDDDAREMLQKYANIPKTSRAIELRVFFEEMISTKSFHTPQYTRQMTLGLVGGHLAFFLGASIFTVMELIEVVILVISRLCNEVIDTDKSKYGGEEDYFDESTPQKG